MLKTFSLIFAAATVVLLSTCEAKTEKLWDAPASNSSSCSRKVVCYYPAWGHYSRANNEGLENLDAHLCTHLIYSFMVLGPDNSIQFAKNYNKDFSILKELKAKNPELKTLLGFGGWSDSNAKMAQYQRLMSGSASRGKFASDAFAAVEKHGFDGLDFDYEFPAKEDEEGFALLIEALRQHFSPASGRTLSMAIPGSEWSLNNEGYDLRSLNDNVDWFNVMSYNFAGSWTKGKPKHHSSNYSVGIDILLAAGIPSSKLILGVPLYGRYWNKIDVSNNETWLADNYNKEKDNGELAYNVICQNVKNNEEWISEVTGSEPFAYGDGTRTWVGFDSVASIEEKMDYVEEMDLGGAMVWELSNDDYQNKCGLGEYPLTKAVSVTLKRMCLSSRGREKRSLLNSGTEDKSCSKKN